MKALIFSFFFVLLAFAAEAAWVESKSADLNYVKTLQDGCYEVELPFCPVGIPCIDNVGNSVYFENKGAQSNITIGEVMSKTTSTSTMVCEVHHGPEASATVGDFSVLTFPTQASGGATIAFYLSSTNNNLSFKANLMKWWITCPTMTGAGYFRVRVCMGN